MPLCIQHLRDGEPIAYRWTDSVWQALLDYLYKEYGDRWHEASPATVNRECAYRLDEGQEVLLLSGDVIRFWRSRRGDSESGKQKV